MFEKDIGLDPRKTMDRLKKKDSHNKRCIADDYRSSMIRRDAARDVLGTFVSAYRSSCHV